MEKSNLDKVKQIVDRCGKENAAYLNLVNENGFMCNVESDSTKTIFTDEMVYFVRTGENSLRPKNINGKNVVFPMTVTAMEYDSIKHAKVHLTFEGLNTFLKEFGLDQDEEWKEFIKKCRALGNTEALGFNLGTDGKQLTQLTLDGNDTSKDNIIPHIKPGI